MVSPQEIEFWAGLAACRQITLFHQKVCLAGIFTNSYAKRDIPFLSEEVEYIVDSGAYQDVTTDSRLEFSKALDRQLMIIDNVGKPANSIVSYDFLVDEKYIGDGKKVKERVDFELAEHYVSETIEAAKYYDSQRKNLGCNLILSAQGVTPKQYKYCANEILKYSNKTDIFGLGGFCILGLRKSLIPFALLTFQKVIPLVAEAGLSKIHIFGVTALDVLYILNKMCNTYGLKLSTDSTAMVRAARFGDYFSVKTGRRKRFPSALKNSWELACLNVVNFGWVLQDIENRYVYKGKRGWLRAIDFDYSIAYNRVLF